MSDAKQQLFLEELARLLMRASTGRLDGRAPVRGDETGPLADAANHALGSFRGLVLEVRAGSEQLVQSVERARERSASLGGGMEETRGHLTSATAASQELVSAAQRCHSSAEQCREVAARSLEMVREAHVESEQASLSRDRMRTSMNETGKRLKRLAESCQEVGLATRVIDDVADQTGVLAVNAAIQASVAGGDAEDGFAIIVEEIRRLSERARAATREIEGLVRAIQNDSAQAVKAAEQATAELVAGGEAIDSGGASLRKAEQVAQSLSNAVEGVAGTLARQGKRAVALAGEVAGAERGLGTLQSDSLAVSVALEQVAEHAATLRRAQEPFRIADDDATDTAAEAATSGARAAGRTARTTNTTNTGTIVLKPAQLKSATGAGQAP